MNRTFLAGCAGVAALAASLVGHAAQATVVVGSTAVASPIAATGFETLPSSLAAGTPYVDGGVSVQYISSNPDDGIQNGVPYALSNPDGTAWWGMIQNQGYTDATLVGGGTFNSFSGLFGSEFQDGDLHVEFLLGGVEVATVDAGPLSTTGQTVSFSNFTADEVRFASPLSGTFGGADELGADDLAFGVDQMGGVPEPATWALMILGFGGAGALLRRRRLAVI
ncbi:MAG TPA: PEPxxWA-CTERM sorting domain-containing protein [Phenylobacterium sp.]|jgi:hypothetical protein|nr:PEPxxWA-CTERM sorting domain-containing protein [Phenylobacterium sp.]